RWPGTPEPTRARIIDSCGELLRTLHKRRWRHGSLYAKHVFLRADDAAPHGFDARFIDLEKSRPLLMAGKEKRRDLQIFARRLTQWRTEEWRRLLSVYLEQPMESRKVGRWMRALKLSEA
ncbi:MAG: lipopolysaccharide kinase InaA family protein, partial [Pseudomonadota bacterium]|nr:lipopolysaccharide kinase InaA family protein [Pseudomonadota bacterium]